MPFPLQRCPVNLNCQHLLFHMRLFLQCNFVFYRYTGKLRAISTAWLNIESDTLMLEEWQCFDINEGHLSHLSGKRITVLERTEETCIENLSLKKSKKISFPSDISFPTPHTVYIQLTTLETTLLIESFRDILLQQKKKSLLLDRNMYIALMYVCILRESL